MSDGVSPGVRWTVDLPPGGGELKVLPDGLLIGGPNWMSFCSFDGETRWTAETGGPGGQRSVLLDERSVARFEDGDVVIREIATGRIQSRWAAPPGSSWLVATPWGDLALFHVEAPVRAVSCLSREGETRWTVTLRNRPLDPPSPAFAVADVLVIAHHGALRAYGPDGEQRWVAGLDGLTETGDPDEPVSIDGSPVRIDADRLLVPLQTRTARDAVELDGRLPSVRRMPGRLGLRPPATTVEGAGDEYVVARAAGRVNLGQMNYVWPLRVQRPDGSVVWEYQSKQEFIGLSAVPGGGFVITGSPTVKIWQDYGKWHDLSDQTFVRMIDASGHEEWTWQAPGLISFSGVVGPDGTAYAGSQGLLYALAADVAEETPARPAVPLARTSHEAHVYLDLTPCECGATGFPRTSMAVELPDGELGSRYTGTCPSCGRERTYLFRLPRISQDVSTDDEIVYGLGTEPSELLDAAQWLSVADRYGETVPADPERLAGDERRIAKTRLMAAAAALWEAAKFIPDSRRSVPRTALWSDLGREWIDREPRRFEEQEIEKQRMAYERAVRRISPPAPSVISEERARRLADPSIDTDPVTGMSTILPRGALAAYLQLRDRLSVTWAADPAERDRRLTLAAGAYAEWRDREGVDDTGWWEDVWGIPEEALPSAESAWAMVRAARAAAGVE